MAKKKTDTEKAPDTLQIAMDDINKRYGSGTVMLIGDGPIEDVDVVSTGSLALDMALGIGGLPRGRTIEIFGAEAAGKTTLALHAIAEAQREGGKAAFIDAEHALDIDYAKRLGVKVEELIISQPSSGEQALDIARSLLKSKKVAIIVIDSVAALTPQAELDGEVGDSHVGLQARLMSQSMRILTGLTSDSNTALVFINQLRMKIGVMFGNPETTSGGRALRFYASVRLDVRAIARLKQDDVVYGSRVRVKVAKNKLAPPYRVCEFNLIHGKGISRGAEIVEIGTSMGIVNRRGAWYSYGDKNIGQGLENTVAFLDENPEVSSEIEGKIKDEWKKRDA